MFCVLNIAPRIPCLLRREFRTSLCTLPVRTLSVASVAIDGHPFTSSETSSEFLKSRASGAYTTARTCCQGQKIFQWQFHIARTASSAKDLIRGDTTLTTKSKTDLIKFIHRTKKLESLLNGTVSAAIGHFRRKSERSNPTAELKITALLSWSQDVTDQCASTSDPTVSVAAHVTALPPIPPPPIRVEVRGAPRDNAGAKASTWVRDRAPLEDLMVKADVGQKGINELLLSTPTPQCEKTASTASRDGNMIYEGSQTNFFAVIGGTLYTAATQDVLAGTVRDITLDVCKREGIDVVFQPPILYNHEGAHDWEGALISSTSRLLLPIDEIYCPVPGRPSQRQDLRIRFNNSDPQSIVHRLTRLVAAEVEANSDAII